MLLIDVYKNLESEARSVCLFFLLSLLHFHWFLGTRPVGFLSTNVSLPVALARM